LWVNKNLQSVGPWQEGGGGGGSAVHKSKQNMPDGKYLIKNKTSGLHSPEKIE
jgi:hypothetical protein